MSVPKQTWQKAVGTAVGLIGTGTAVTGIGMGLDQTAQEVNEAADKLFPAAEAGPLDNQESEPPIDNTRVFLIVGGGVLLAAGVKLALDGLPTPIVQAETAPAPPAETAPDNIRYLPSQLSAQDAEPKIATA